MKIVLKEHMNRFEPPTNSLVCALVIYVGFGGLTLWKVSTLQYCL